MQRTCLKCSFKGSGAFIVIGEVEEVAVLYMAVVNEVWMMEMPLIPFYHLEGFASILYKDSKKFPEARG